MGFFDRFRSKQSTTTNAIVGYNHGMPARKHRAYQDYAKDGYQDDVDIYRCINLITEAMSGIDWILLKAAPTSRSARKALRAKGQRFRGLVDEWRYLKSDDFVEIENHPLLDLIRRPNPNQGNTTFVDEWAKNLLIYGNSYIERVGPGKNSPLQPPAELWNLRADRMTVNIGDAKQLVTSYTYKNGNKERELPFEMVMHTKLYHPLDDWYGLSPIESVARQIDQTAAAETWNLALLENGGMPSGFFMLEDVASDDQIQQIKAMRDQMRGSKNAGRIGLLEGGLDFREAQMKSADISWLEGLKLNTLKKAQAYGVAPELIGDQSQKTYSNYQEARRALYMETVLPKMDLLRDELNTWLTTLYGDGLMLDYDRDSIEALSENQDAVYARVNGAQFLMVNEKRAELGFDAITGGDVVLVPAMNTTLETISAEPVADMNREPVDVGEIKSKAWNLVTPSLKAAHAGTVEALRAHGESTARGMIRQQFQKERRSVVSAIRNAHGPMTATVAALKTVDADRSGWESLYKSVYLRVGTVHAEHVLASLKSQNATSFRRKDIDPDAWMKDVLEYLRTNGAKRVIGVTDTTKQSISDAITKGVLNGEGTHEIAKRVDDLYLEQIIPNRSETIARTETLTASNLASFAAADSTGVAASKQWIAVEDSRTRSTHSQADGQSVPMEESFEIGGTQMDFPGDDSKGADAGEIVNCRCVVSFGT